MGFELLKNILLQDRPSILIKKNEDIIFKIVPELEKCKGFNQNNKWHIFDVYEHILHVVDGVPNCLPLRIAALFHDIGKPIVYKEDINGIGHFYDHWTKSKQIFIDFATRYNLNEEMKILISNLIFYHDLSFDKISKSDLDKLINTFNYNDIVMLFELKRSDLMAQNSKYHYLLSEYERQEKKLLKRYR